MLCRYCTTAIVDSVTMSVITTINSMIVKPAADRNLPVTIFRSIQCGAVEGGADIENVLPTPVGGIRIVLIGPQGPLRVLRHRINRDTPQKLEFAAGGVVGRRDAVDQRFEIGRVPFA